MDLQDGLRSLCNKTGWCYAVFWKLKRRSRMVLTWEDGYYEYAKSSAVCEQFSSDSRLRGGNGCLEAGGNPLDQACAGHEASYTQGQIGLAVAKMSYYVYSMGEGIIGRVAFTGKHQWVFGGGENNCVEAAPGGVLNNRCMLEKYLAGWQNQFAAGIKTIAVIAVPQGVVQLGSTQMILEDPKWVDHIKSVFGTLQSVRGAFLSDLLSEGQGGKSVICTPVRSAESPSAAPARPTTFDRAQCCLGNVKDVNATLLRPFVYGSKGRPSFVKDLVNIQGLQSRAEDNGSAKAMLQETHVRQAKEAGTEAHVSKPITPHSGTQNLQLYSRMMPLNLPSNVNKISPLPGDDMGTCPLTDAEEMLLKENHVKEFHSPSSMVFVTGIGTENDAGAFMSPHSDILPDASCNQETPSVNGMLILENISNFKMNESLLGVNLANDQQHRKVTSLNVLTRVGGHKAGLSTRAKHLPTENHPCSLLKCDMGSEILNLPPVEGNLSTQVCRDLAQTADAAWSLPAKRMKSNLFDGAGVAATVHDSLCSIVDQASWDHDGLVGCASNSVSQSRGGHVEHSCRDLEPNVMSNNSLAAGCFVDCGNHSPPFSMRQIDCSFAIGDELSQALGPGFRKGHSKELWEEILLHSCGAQLKEAPNHQTLRGSSQQSEPEVAPTWGSSLVEDNLHNGFGLHFAENRSEPLLDAVVGNASSSHHSVSTNADDSFSGKTTFSVLDSGMSVMNSIKEEDYKHATREFFAKGYVQPLSDCKATVDVHNISQVSDAKGHPNFHLLSTWMDEGKSMKSDNTEPSQTRKPEDVAKASRKRPRPGESTRPRPKDRQQIQDRVRELRGIVPNGSKCSIDALLEKTIRHMIFLQTVSRHADKLKKNGEFKDDMESGASWALDFGGQQAGCPILVENLSQPHQMLVEMLCEERGLFLEIADIIRKLGLTILKGVMESRVDKVWARFIVEAERDVPRIEVVLSLMQLLHLNNSSSSSMTTASQSGPTRSQQGINSSSSQTQCGFQQSSFSA